MTDFRPEHLQRWLEWMNPSTTVAQAKEFLSVARPESAFHGYEVTRVSSRPSPNTEGMCS